MRYLLYILVVSLPLVGFSQNYANKDFYLIDSLLLSELEQPDSILLYNSLSQYHSSKRDTQKIDALTNICEGMMHESWEKYQIFQYKIIKEAESKKLTAKEKKYLQKSKGQAYSNIGFIYDNHGNTSLALKYYFLALKSFEQNNLLEDQAGALTNIGTVYDSQGDTAQALKYYFKAEKIYEIYDDKLGLATVVNNIGSLYKDSYQMDKALIYFKRGLAINEKMNDHQSLAYSYGYIGVVYGYNKEYEIALDYFIKGLEIRREIGDKIGITHSLINIGAICLKRNQLNKAKAYFSECLELAQYLDYSNGIKNSSQKLVDVYEKLGNSEQALKMFKLHIQTRDSISNEATQKATAKQQAKYEYEKQKVLDDAAHDKELAIEQEEKEKQQILTGATAAGLGLLVVFLIFVFNRLRVTKKQKFVIEKQKNEVEQQKEVVEQAHTELEEKNQEIMDSITYAKRIQSAILPPIKVVKEYLQESFILYKPKDIVAGDFYWLEHSKGKVLFAAADCTGHGVPGAMVSVVCNNGLNRSVREYGLTDPGEILSKTREIVVQEFAKSEEDVKDGMDIALCSLEGKTLKYAGAHNPLWIIRDGEILETKANKQPIGQFDNPEPYTTHTFELQKKDAVYIFSDGYVDQFGGEKGKKFKAKAFRELLLSIQDKSMEGQKVIIDEAFETWRGSLEQIDDVCVIGVRI